MDTLVAFSFSLLQKILHYFICLSELLQNFSWDQFLAAGFANDMCIYSFNEYHQMPRWEVALTYIPTSGIRGCSPAMPSPSPGFQKIILFFG